MITALRIRVVGKVQGVWFRKFVKDSAETIDGITGWVRNEPNGSVRIEAAGEKKKLQKLVTACHQGPELSRIDSVETEEIAPQEWEGFVIQ